jgi:hypothetical protein
MTSILTPEEVEHLRETRVGDPNDKYPFTAKDWHQFAASLESAILAKLAAKAGELPEPERTRKVGWSEEVDFTADQLRSHTAAMAARVEVLERVLTPFIGATLTDQGQVIGLMREDFDRARAALFPAKKD